MSDESYAPAILTTAGQLQRQYGEDAAVIAVLRAAEIATTGDPDALDHWDRVIACLEAWNGSA